MLRLHRILGQKSMKDFTFNTDEVYIHKGAIVMIEVENRMDSEDTWRKVTRIHLINGLSFCVTDSPSKIAEAE